MGSQYIVEVNRMKKFRGDDEDSHQEDGVQLHGEDFLMLPAGGDLPLLHGEGLKANGDEVSQEELGLPDDHRVGWLEGGGVGSQGGREVD